MAKALTPNALGMTNVIDVGGMSTLAESMKSVGVEGVVTLTGVLGDAAQEEAEPSIMSCLYRVFSVRGVLLGTREQLIDMVNFIEEKGIEPVVDEKIFGINEVKEAFSFLESQRHFSKVVIKIV
jgi:D-arabinose 1-dehydrogenase-like Zn-dependent alcohol dehydrogenase